MAKTSKQNQQKRSNNSGCIDDISSSNSTSNTRATTNPPIISNTTKTTKTKRTRKSVPRDSPQQRSSVYRGVTRHRWTGRYEAHLWDKNYWNESQNKKGRQVYLGAYDDEAAAAHAYDLVALKYWGHDTILNFPLSTYENEFKNMEGQAKEEYVGSLRRKSSGFSRGVSKYRGVARRHHNGRWEARIGRVFGNKYLYLGTYATQEEAATAYDMAAIEYRGLNAVTNFDLSRYFKWLRPNQTGNGNGCTHDSITPQENPDPNLEVNDPTPNANQEGVLNFLQKQPQQSSSSAETTSTTTTTEALPASSGTTASSTLRLLLQSSKFKEMLERTAAVDSQSPTTELPRSSFPDDIQTYFDCQDTGSFPDEHDNIFGDYNSFASTMFPCELET